jgi:hypothetical protein
MLLGLIEIVFCFFNDEWIAFEILPHPKRAWRLHSILYIISPCLEVTLTLYKKIVKKEKALNMVLRSYGTEDYISFFNVIFCTTLFIFPGYNFLNLHTYLLYGNIK